MHSDSARGCVVVDALALLQSRNFHWCTAAAAQLSSSTWGTTTPTTTTTTYLMYRDPSSPTGTVLYIDFQSSMISLRPSLPSKSDSKLLPLPLIPNAAMACFLAVPEAITIPQSITPTLSIHQRSSFSYGISRRAKETCLIHPSCVFARHSQQDLSYHVTLDDRSKSTCHYFLCTGPKSQDTIMF